MNSLEKDSKCLSLKNVKAQTNKVDIKRLELTAKRGISQSPDRKLLQLTDRGEEASCKSILNEAMKTINALDFKDFFEKLSHFRQSLLKYKKIKKLIDKISDMIVQCSPSGYFNNEPSIHQIWKWLTRVLEEYMKLKQSVSGESFNRLCRLLGTASIEEMVEKVVYLQNSRSRGLLRST